jgi:hypothetical protein
MKIILYNQSCPELIFSAASIISKFYEESGGKEPESEDEIRYFMPMRACDLNKDIFELAETLNKDLEEIGDEDYFVVEDLLKFQPEYILLGIYPQDKEDEGEIVTFFDKNVDKISLWIDTHYWPNNLRTYLQGKPGSIFLDPSKTSLAILADLDYPFFDKWLITEEAMIQFDLKNRLAFRYFKAILLPHLLTNRYRPRKAYDFLTFLCLIEEIAFLGRDPYIAELVKTYRQTIEFTDEAKRMFRDDNPIFEKIKNMGRPCGYLFLDAGINNLDIEETMEYGMTMFPWLVVLEYPSEIKGVNAIYFASKRIPIIEIINAYANDNIDTVAILKIMSAEVAGYQEKVNS